MNSLPILKALCGDIKNCEHWLSGRNESAQINMETRVLDFARQLLDARDERIKDLKENGPRVFMTDGELNIVLLRTGADGIEEENHHNFVECFVEVTNAHFGSKQETWDLVRNMKWDRDGRIHFLLVRHMDSPAQSFAINITMEEAAQLKKSIPAAEHAYEERLYGEKAG